MILAVIEVGEFTVKLLITTLGKVSTVTPCCQLVLVPLMVTVRVATLSGVVGRNAVDHRRSGGDVESIVQSQYLRAGGDREVAITDWSGGWMNPSTVNDVELVTLNW